MNTTDILGFIAAALTTLAAIPQLIKIIKTKSAGDVSIVMFSMTFSGLACWTIYGILLKSWPLILANSFSVCLVALIIYYKLKYDRKKAKTKGLIRTATK